MGPATGAERRPTKKEGKPPPAQKEVAFSLHFAFVKFLFDLLCLESPNILCW